MGRIDQATLDYISALRKRLALSEAVLTLSVLADAMPRSSLAEDSGQFTLDLEAGIALVSDSPAVSVAKEWLQENARWVRVDKKSEEQRWNCFLTIAKSIGLALAINWVLWNCLALCVPDEKSPYDRTQVA